MWSFAVTQFIMRVFFCGALLVIILVTNTDRLGKKNIANIVNPYQKQLNVRETNKPTARKKKLKLMHYDKHERINVKRTETDGVRH